MLATRNLPAYAQLKNLLGYPADRLAIKRPICHVTAIKGIWAPQHLCRLLSRQSFIKAVKQVKGRHLLVTLHS